MADKSVRKIELEEAEGEHGARRLSVTREGEVPLEKIAKKSKEKEVKKLESNPRVILAVLGVTLVLGAGTWIWRGWRGVVSDLTSPRVSEVLPTMAPKRNIDWKKVREGILVSIGERRGDWAVYIYDLESGSSMGMKENLGMTAASLIKLPVMVTAYKMVEDGDLDLNEVYTLKGGDKVAGAGSLYYAEEGSEYTLRKLIELMGQQSDNTAYRVMVKRVGEERITQTIGDIGMKNTIFEDNRSSALDMGVLMTKLASGKLLNKKNTEEMLKFLTKTIFEDRIPTGVPSGVKVAHKVGTEIGVVSDAGVVFGKHPYVISLMTEGVNAEEAKKVLPEISRLVWEEIEGDNKNGN